MNAARWYIAVIVIASSIKDVSEDAPAVDLQYRLIRAVDHEEAYRRAIELGRNESHSYENSAGSTVRWEFAGLHDLRELDESELVDGTEVYSRIVREKAGQYIVAKERLTCFWSAAHAHKTAAQVLKGED